MNYRQTLDYLYSQLPMFQRVGAAAYKADLNNTLEMCRLLGHPERGFHSVHIAGTNGKGSTAHLVAAVLQSAGYKTGLFTSPHLKDFRERIRINGKKIPRTYVSSFVANNRKKFSKIKPSFFEYTTMMAFLYFADEKVDIAVLETGMGGRLDSTNVVTPLISVITNISYDHMTYLGDTLEKIAQEKSGIIKHGVPVVIGETQPGPEQVFLDKAREIKAPIYFADKNYSLGRIEGHPEDFYLRPNDEEIFHCPLTGEYQDKNLVTAYQALKILDRGMEITGPRFRINQESIRQGYRDVIRITGLQGRWQTLKKRPRVICDVGHNESGITYIVNQLKADNHDTLHWVFGMVNDKDTDGILRLLPYNAIYYFCKADIPRGMDANELQKIAKNFNLKGNVYGSVKDAYNAALTTAGPKDLVFVGGSTFIVAEVL